MPNTELKKKSCQNWKFSLPVYLPDHIWKETMQNMATKLCHNYKLTSGMFLLRFWWVSFPVSIQKINALVWLCYMKKVIIAINI